MFRLYLITFFSLGILCALNAQSCCSGGVPLSSNLGMPEAEVGTVQLNLSYDVNVLNTLKVGQKRLDDRSRKRITHTSLLEWGYTFHPKFSIEGFFAFLSQERRITQSVGEDVAIAQGIGDAVILLNTQLLSWQAGQGSWHLAIGAKAPLGKHDITDNKGLIFNAELQPGSGAWDGIFWTQWLQNSALRPSMSFSATLAYSLKGKNKQYLRDQVYQFGNELQIAANVSDRLLWKTTIIDPGLSLRYRKVTADQFNEADLPATGGAWIFINPSLNFWLRPNLSWSISATFPIYAKVVDTQFSPTYRLNTGIFYRFSTKKTNPLVHPLGATLKN